MRQSYFQKLVCRFALDFFGTGVSVWPCFHFHKRQKPVVLFHDLEMNKHSYTVSISSLIQQPVTWTCSHIFRFYDADRHFQNICVIHHFTHTWILFLVIQTTTYDPSRTCSFLQIMNDSAFIWMNFGSHTQKGILCTTNITMVWQFVQELFFLLVFFLKYSHFIHHINTWGGTKCVTLALLQAK